MHLTIKDTLKELHLRIPSPERVKEKRKPRALSATFAAIFENRFPGIRPKKPKKVVNKPSSPYLVPFPFREQHHKNYIYKNRHKEQPFSKYFNYKDQMVRAGLVYFQA